MFIANHAGALGPVHTRTIMAATEAQFTEAEFRNFQATELSCSQFAPVAPAINCAPLPSAIWRATATTCGLSEDRRRGLA